MVGHKWLPWINNPTPGSTLATSTKQEQEISAGCLKIRNTATCRRSCLVVGLSTFCLLLLASCVALSVLYVTESDGSLGWKSLLDSQNISGSYLALTRANDDVRRDDKVLKKQRSWLDERTKLLNKTSAGLASVNSALSSESSELTEKIVNLTNTNLQLVQEYERLVRVTATHEEEKLNTSETIEQLVGSNARREEEKRRLSETNDLLRDELLRTKEANRELAETNDSFDKNLSEKIGTVSKMSEDNAKLRETLSELQEQNQNLSTTLARAAERERTRTEEVKQKEADGRSANEAYRLLDLYCPVVNQNTDERICRKCPDNWRLFQARCYYFSSRLLTWSSSRAWCRTQGGDLLIVNSQSEQSFISETGHALQHSSGRLWIGMTDAEVEGEWRWVDGSPVTSKVQFWLSRPGVGTEPDDWKLDDPLGEDCGHIDTSENALRSWMDGSCKIPHRWICEKSI